MMTKTQKEESSSTVALYKLYNVSIKGNKLKISTKIIQISSEINSTL